jgi:hypothetical protein
VVLAAVTMRDSTQSCRRSECNTRLHGSREIGSREVGNDEADVCLSTWIAA